MENHYKTLGVAENASASDIKKAYKKLATEHHPDKHGGDDSRMKDINSAYDTLKNPKKREEYDTVRKYGGPNQGGPFGGFGRQQPHGYPGGQEFHFNSGGPGHMNMDDFIREAMSRQGGFGQRPPVNRDINLQHQITLEEAFKGKTVEAKWQMPNGEQRAVTVDIPAGVEHGDRVRFAGQGYQEHANIQPGDLFVHIIIANHPRFVRRGQTLLTGININAIDAMVGTTIPVQNIENKQVNLTIPAGTQPGTQLRLRGQGFTMKGIPGRGDLLVEVAINISKSLTSKEESLLRELQKLRKNA